MISAIIGVSLLMAVAPMIWDRGTYDTFDEVEKTIFSSQVRLAAKRINIIAWPKLPSLPRLGLRCMEV